MRKVFIAEFGGTASRTELCLLMNCGAGLYGDMDFTIYPFDKDIYSPNYVNSRAFCEDYQTLHQLNYKEGFGSANVGRRESLFEEILSYVNVGKAGERIRSLVADNGILKEKEQMLLDICFEREEQDKELEGGYYGKANIGAVTSSFLIYKKAYEQMDMVADIEKANKAGVEVDVVIICSSFGGTGASLGTNFGVYLSERFPNREKIRIHCIHIQPYFSFPDPEKEDQWQIDCHEFYDRSATVIAAYGGKKNFIRNIIKNNGKTETYVFDSFYYLGQEVLDQVSDKNAARDEQENSLHMIDMLVSMAVEDAVNRSGREEGQQLYGYIYSKEGTEYLSWENMADLANFRKRHKSFARFSAFVLQVLEPLFRLDSKKYITEALIAQLYGASGLFTVKAAVFQENDDIIRQKMETVTRFCRKYLEYWGQIENTTRYGKDTSVTRFFNQDELVRVITEKSSLEEGRKFLKLDSLTAVEESTDQETHITGMAVYDSLSNSRELKNCAAKGESGEAALKKLLKECYLYCSTKEEGK